MGDGRGRERRTHGRGRGGEEDQAAEVSCALVGEGSSRVDQGSNTIALQGGSDSLWRWSASWSWLRRDILRNCAHGCAPGDSDIGGLLGLDELLAGVGALSTLVGLAEHRGQDFVTVSVSCGLTGGRGAHAHLLSQ